MSNNQLTMEHSGIGLPPVNRYFSLLIIKIVGLKYFLKNTKVSPQVIQKLNKIKLKINSVPYGTCH